MTRPRMDTGCRHIPSPQHEARRATLETIATLAGFTVTLPFPHGAIPDVSRVSIPSGSVFVGEAKHSENANDLRAISRIETYMRWLSHPRPRTRPDLVCVCHPIQHSTGWLSALETIADAVGANRIAGGSAVLSHDAVLTWITCAAQSPRPLIDGTVTPSNGSYSQEPK